MEVIVALELGLALAEIATKAMAEGRDVTEEELDDIFNSMDASVKSYVDKYRRPA